MTCWTPSSWRCHLKEPSNLFNDDAFDNAQRRLQTLPPITSVSEIEKLKRLIAEAGTGNQFLLQGGICQEDFNSCHGPSIDKNLKLLIQISLVLVYHGRIPVARVFRGAGQLVSAHCTRSDLFGPTPESLRADASLFVEAYFHSVATLNYVRSQTTGGFADLNHPDQWDFEDIGKHPAYKDIVEQVLDALNFLKTLKAENEASTTKVDIFASHEAFVLPYEESLTKQSIDRFYNNGTHLLLLAGNSDGLSDMDAHIEYLRGLANPIGIQIDATIAHDRLVQLTQQLNPTNELGKIILITGYGAANVTHNLSCHISAVQQAHLNVVWSCNPVQNNSSFQEVVLELTATFRAHQVHNTILGGISLRFLPHLNKTSNSDEDTLTKCAGQNFPCLNYYQSIQLALLISASLRRKRDNGQYLEDL